MNNELNVEQEGKETAAADAGQDQKRPAGLLRVVPVRRHPRLVYENPDVFFLDLLMEQNEQQ